MPFSLFLDLVSKSNIYHKKRTHTTGRKNSTLLEENLSAKDIQEVSFFNDVSDISGMSKSNLNFSVEQKLGNKNKLYK